MAIAVVAPVPAEPLRFRLQRVSNHRWRSEVFRSNSQREKKRQTTLELRSQQWFCQGGPCYVVRRWTEIQAHPEAKIQRVLGTAPEKQQAEDRKGRILGTTRQGRVWVAVYFVARRPGYPANHVDGFDRWWELRLVDPEDIEPLGAGQREPPPLPEICRSVLGDLPLQLLSGR